MNNVENVAKVFCLSIFMVISAWLVDMAKLLLSLTVVDILQEITIEEKSDQKLICFFATLLA